MFATEKQRIMIDEKIILQVIKDGKSIHIVSALEWLIE